MVMKTVCAWFACDDWASCCCLWWQNLESLSFGSRGDEFISAHIDGSYTVWQLSDAARPKFEPVTPYGLFINVTVSHCTRLCFCTYICCSYQLKEKFYCVRQHICYSTHMLSPVRPSVCLSVRPSVCLSVCLSHGWISQKRLKLGSCNFHYRVAPWL